MPLLYQRKQQGGLLYDMDRANELGYLPDSTGHLPSVDHETGKWLKDKKHPTAWKELLYGYQLKPKVHKYFIPIQREDGSIQYVRRKGVSDSTFTERPVMGVQQP